MKKRKSGRKTLSPRVKFTTTLPPETILDLNVLAVEDGHASSAQVIVKLVKAAMARRSDNQTAGTK